MPISIPIQTAFQWTFLSQFSITKLQYYSNTFLKGLKAQEFFPRVIQEDHSFTIMVQSQFKLEFFQLQVHCVDIITLPMLPISQFPILELGLIVSCLYHDATFVDNV